MFERRHQPLLSSRRLVVRMLWANLLAFGIIIVALGIGILGYHWSEDLRWLDALLNASMILTGEGPVHLPASDAGKWFASFYALFSGLVFVTATAILVTPIAHRLLHHFHLESRRRDD